MRGRPFIVFHDAYQYFEHRFAFPAAGSIALQDGVTPGAARVAAIRDRVRGEGIVCAFAEPQFEPKLLATVIEGTDVRTGVLDPASARRCRPGPSSIPRCSAASPTASPTASAADRRAAAAPLPIAARPRYHGGRARDAT